MGSNQKIDFKYMLCQMLSGKLSNEENTELWQYIQSTYKDSELDSLMREHWSGLKNQDSLADEMKMFDLKNQIISRIKKAKTAIKKQHRLYPYNWEKSLMRIAAMLFLPLLLGSAFVFYQMNMKLDQMSGPEAMQQVKANPGSRVHFTLPDKTEVWLNSGSMLEFPNNLSQLDQRKVRLSGQGYFKVAHDKKHPFFVETELMSIKALGTSFDVSSYAEDNQISSTLEEGSIALFNLQGEEMALLYPGQMSVFDISPRKLEVNDVETILTTSWKDGKLYFRNTSLPDVMKQLERWFNCKIHVDSLLLKSELFYTATIEDETLGEVLKMIEISTAVQTKIVKRDVYIERKKYNRIGETGLFPVSSFHTTVRTVRYTAVP